MDNREWSSIPAIGPILRNVWKAANRAIIWCVKCFFLYSFQFPREYRFISWYFNHFHFSWFHQDFVGCQNFFVLWINWNYNKKSYIFTSPCFFFVIFVPVNLIDHIFFKFFENSSFRMWKSDTMIISFQVNTNQLECLFKVTR